MTQNIQVKFYSTSAKFLALYCPIVPNMIDTERPLVRETTLSTYTTKRVYGLHTDNFVLDS